MDLLTLSRDLIAADTVSHKGTAAAVSILRPLYLDAGLEVTVQERREGEVRHQNLLGTYAGTDPASLLLVTHLDTVDTGPLELWTETEGNPHSLTQKGDRIYGLGSADTKLDSLCKLFAARTFKGRKLRRTLQLLGTFEEEVGCKGAKHFARSSDFRARFASCSEPSELVIIRGHKGYAVVRVKLSIPDAPRVHGPFERVVFEGKAAHSSTPHLGINALEKAFTAVRGTPVVSLDGGTVSNKVPARCTVIRQSRAGQTSAGPVSAPEARDVSGLVALSEKLFYAWKARAARQVPEVNSSFDPDRSVVNWGVARLQGLEAELVFDCRLLPGHDPDALTQGFSEEARELAVAAGAQLEVDVERANPAMELREPSELLSSARAACRDVGLDDTPAAKPTNTEAGVFASAGIEAIVFGPGRSTGNAHCANEHNLYSQMEKAVEFYRALITRLCV